MSVDLPAMHRQALAYSQGLMDQVTAADLDRPTPCEGWDVKELVHHTVYGNLWVAPLVGGETIEEVGDRFEGDILGGDVGAAHAQSAAVAAAAFEAPGAMEVPVAVSYGPVPGSMYCGHRLIDVVVHGWDLATALGADTTVPADLVDACIEVAVPQQAILAGSGMFGSSHDPGPDADPQDRLLALMGRSA